jgi:hypothetical protein
MTMPQGSAEEPTAQWWMPGSIPPHVVSSDEKPGKSIAPEFGRWRTVLVSNVQNQTSSTPGAVRIANRSLRRHRLHIFVQPTIIAQTTTDGVIIGGRDEINSGNPAVVGSLGGFLPIGASLRWEAQMELWVCYPLSNVNSVFVTVCDEVYASEPDAYKASE